MVSRKSGTKKTVKSTGKQFTLDMVVAKKPTVKKTAAKKPTTKKPTTVKKTTVKKTTAKKPTVKKTAATKKTVATKKSTTTKKPTVKKTTAVKPTVKKTTAPKKPTVKKTAKYHCKLYVDGIFEKSFEADSYDEIEREKRIAYDETGADEVEVRVESKEFANAKKSVVGRKPVIKKPNDSYYIVRQPTKRTNLTKIIGYTVRNGDWDTFGENIKSIEKARVIAAYHCDEGERIYIFGVNAIHDEIYCEELRWVYNQTVNDYSDLGFYCERTTNYRMDNEDTEYYKIDPKTGKIIDTKYSYRRYFHYSGW